MEPTKLPSISSLIERTWNLFKTNPKGFILIYGIPMTPILLVTLVLVLGLFATQGSTAVMILLFPILGIVATICSLWQTSSCAVFIIAAANSQTMTVKAALSQGWAKKGLVFKTLVPSCLATWGASIPLIFPAIIVLNWIFAGVWIALEENISGRPALLKSKALVSGRSAAVFGRFLVLFGLIIVVSILLGILEIIPIAGSILSLLGNIMIAPLMGIYMYLMYSDLKSTRPNPEVPAKTPLWLTLSIVLGGLLVAFWFFAMAALIAINPTDKLEKAKMQRDSYQEMMKMYQNEISVSPIPTLNPSYQLEDDPGTLINTISSTINSPSAVKSTTFNWVTDFESQSSINIQGYSIDITNVTFDENNSLDSILTNKGFMADSNNEIGSDKYGRRGFKKSNIYCLIEEMRNGQFDEQGFPKRDITFSCGKI